MTIVQHKGGQTDSKTIAAKILVDGEPELMAVVVRYVENEHIYKAHKVYMPDGTVVDIEKTGLASVAAAEAADTHNPVPNKNIAQEDDSFNLNEGQESDDRSTVLNGIAPFSRILSARISSMRAKSCFFQASTYSLSSPVSFVSLSLLSVMYSSPSRIWYRFQADTSTLRRWTESLTFMLLFGSLFIGAVPCVVLDVNGGWALFA